MLRPELMRRGRGINLLCGPRRNVMLVFRGEHEQVQERAIFRTK